MIDNPKEHNKLSSLDFFSTCWIVGSISSNLPDKRSGLKPPASPPNILKIDFIVFSSTLVSYLNFTGPCWWQEVKVGFSASAVYQDLFPPLQGTREAWIWIMSNFFSQNQWQETSECGLSELCQRQQRRSPSSSPASSLRHSSLPRQYQERHPAAPEMSIEQWKSWELHCCFSGHTCITPLLFLQASFSPIPVKYSSGSSANPMLGSTSIAKRLSKPFTFVGTWKSFFCKKLSCVWLSWLPWWTFDWRHLRYCGQDLSK